MPLSLLLLFCVVFGAIEMTIVPYPVYGSTKIGRYNSWPILDHMASITKKICILSVLLNIEQGRTLHGNSRIALGE
jgi:hypothetical protein